MKREKLLAAAPLIIFGLLVLVLVIALHHGAPSNKSVLHIGDLAPATDLPVLGQQATHFTNSAWHDRPYIVNFFASWSEDSKAEHEELMTLAAGQVPVIGITYKDNADKVATYLDRAGTPYIAVAQDDEGHAGDDWGVVKAPETFVVDAYGIIRWHHSGALTGQIVSNELMPVWEAVARGN